MADKPKRSAWPAFYWTLIGVAIIWGGIWNGLDTAFPDASLDAGAGPPMGFIFGLVAGAVAYRRRSRGKSLTPVFIGVAVWFVAFGAFVATAGVGPPAP